MAYTRVRFKAPQTLFGERGLPFWANARLAAINWHRKRAWWAVANHAPLHFIEIIFYSTASLLAAIGLAWYFLK
jgi:hypothetical protein